MLIDVACLERATCQACGTNCHTPPQSCIGNSSSNTCISNFATLSLSLFPFFSLSLSQSCSLDCPFPFSPFSSLPLNQSVGNLGVGRCCRFLPSQDAGRCHTACSRALRCDGNRAQHAVLRFAACRQERAKTPAFSLALTGTLPKRADKHMPRCCMKRRTSDTTLPLRAANACTRHPRGRHTAPQHGRHHNKQSHGPPHQRHLTGCDVPGPSTAEIEAVHTHGGPTYQMHMAPGHMPERENKSTRPMHGHRSASAPSATRKMWLKQFELS